MSAASPVSGANRRRTTSVPVTLRRRSVGAAILAVLLAGCSGGGDAGTGPAPVQPGTIALTLTPGSITVPTGGTGSAGISVTRGGGFSGPVTLTAAGVPVGVTLTFGTTTVASGAVSTSLNASVAASAATGSSEISIVANGTGASQGTATLQLRVQ